MKKKSSDRIFNIIIYLIVVIVLIAVLYPLVYIISASISSPTAVNSGKMWLFPKDITFEGYQIIFKNKDIWNGYLNTIIYTLVGTMVNLIFTIPAGYALSRRELPGRNVIMKFILVTMFISGGLIPSYLLITGLGLKNSMWALILPGAVSVYNLIVVRTYFQSNVPEELIESAIIDGASFFRIFFEIVLPLSKPILAVMALFYGIGHWNQYFGALLYIDDRKKYPLQMILREILVIQDMSSNPNMSVSGEMAQFLYSQQQLAQVIKYGVMIVSTLPIILIYPFLQKYFVKGVMIGSIKG